MRLESVLFGSNTTYRRMANVLQTSASINSPDTLLTIQRIDSADDEIMSLTTINTMHTYIDNVRKTKHHSKIVQDAKDGEIIGLLDSDLMVVNSLTGLDHDFDLAYTVRPTFCKLPFNTGVIFVKISDKIREWYRMWYQLTLKLLQDSKLMVEMKKKYGRINQSAFGMLLEQYPDMLKMVKLPCEVWNSIPDTWKNFNPLETKIVHVMGPLRWAIINNQQRIMDSQTNRLLTLWRKYEQALEH